MGFARDDVLLKEKLRPMAQAWGRPSTTTMEAAEGCQRQRAATKLCCLGNTRRYVVLMYKYN